MITIASISIGTCNSASASDESFGMTHHFTRFMYSEGTGYDLQSNPQHFSISIFPNAVMFEFMLALLTKYGWTSVTGLVDMTQLEGAYLNRVMYEQFRSTFSAAGIGADYRAGIQYHDLHFRADFGPMEIEMVLRKMSEASRGK